MAEARLGLVRNALCDARPDFKFKLTYRSERGPASVVEAHGPDPEEQDDADEERTWPPLTPSKFKLSLNLGTPAAQQLRPPLETALPPCAHIKGRS